jgi:hypothetical protein
MKMILALLVLSTSVMAAPPATKKPLSPKEAVTNKTEPKTKEPNALDKKPEDCDAKAKKPVEITPEAISLSGTTGCSLDEAHP